MAKNYQERELRCCLYCGRDTTSLSQICHRCIGGGGGFRQTKEQINDTKDRPILPITLCDIADDHEYDKFKSESFCTNGDKSTERFLNRMNKK